MAQYKLNDLIDDLPDSISKNKHSSSFRTGSDFQEMYPNLTSDEAFAMAEQVSNTYPGTYQRKKVVEYFSNLHSSRTSPSL